MLFQIKTKNVFSHLHLKAKLSTNAPTSDVRNAFGVALNTMLAITLDGVSVMKHAQLRNISHQIIQVLYLFLHQFFLALQVLRRRRQSKQQKRLPFQRPQPPILLPPHQ